MGAAPRVAAAARCVHSHAGGGDTVLTRHFHDFLFFYDNREFWQVTRLLFRRYLDCTLRHVSELPSRYRIFRPSPTVFSGCTVGPRWIALKKSCTFQPRVARARPQRRVVWAAICRYNHFWYIGRSLAGAEGLVVCPWCQWAWPSGPIVVVLRAFFPAPCTHPPPFVGLELPPRRAEYVIPEPYHTCRGCVVCVLEAGPAVYWWGP